MDLVTFSNMMTKVSTNVVEAIETNATGADAYPEYDTAATPIPSLIYSVTQTDGGSTFEKGKATWTVDVSCIAATTADVSTLAQEVYDIFHSTYRDTFGANNMYIAGNPVTSSAVLNKGSERYPIRTITVIFTVDEQ